MKSSHEFHVTEMESKMSVVMQQCENEALAFFACNLKIIV